MASQTRSPSSVVNDTAIGVIPWTNPGNATASDDLRASADLSEGDITNYLKATSFGFTIPSGSTILGIVVEAEVSKSGSGTVVDNACRLVKNGVIQSVDRSNGTSWSTADAYLSHGGSTDLWADTWTPELINASSFGCALSAQNSSIQPATALCDHLRITVYYQEGSGHILSTQMI